MASQAGCFWSILQSPLATAICLPPAVLPAPPHWSWVTTCGSTRHLCLDAHEPGWPFSLFPGHLELGSAGVFQVNWPILCGWGLGGKAFSTTPGPGGTAGAGLREEEGWAGRIRGEKAEVKSGA